jgi:hypothetical protein
VNQHVKGFASRRSHTWFCGCWCTDIGCGIWSGFTAFVDVIKFAVWIFGEDEVVVQDMFVALFEAQIQDNTGASGFVGSSRVEFLGGFASC